MKVTIKDDVMRNKIKDTLIRIELLKSLQQENKQLKEVIEEVREYINNLGTQDGMLKDYKIDRFIKEDLLEMLDKAKENN